MRDVWITGIGLVSSLGEGLDAHWSALAGTGQPRPAVDLALAPPFPVHRLVPLELDRQIPRRSDQRQMDPWLRTGVYAAGLALTDAGVAGNEEMLGRTHAIVAGDGGERDVVADTAILDGIRTAENPEAFLNERLATDLRPTLFLAQLPNLLGGNITIVHKVTGASRTFMGEELAGVSALDVATRRIAADQGDIVLAGAVYLGERKDVILNNTLAGHLWAGDPVPVWARVQRGGGITLGSAAAFLVLEAPDHAKARGRQPYARLAGIRTGRCRRRPGETRASLGALFDELVPGGEAPAVLSGVTGIAEVAREEHDLLAALIGDRRVATVRAAATVLGRLSNTTFPALTALAALALSRKGFFPPFESDPVELPVGRQVGRIAVTSAGIRRGEAVGLVEAVG